MTLDSILAAIDAEIEKLQQARAMLTNEVSAAPKKRLGRPKGSKSQAVLPTPKKRLLSEDARARIAAAQKKRWAAAKKSK